MKLINPLVLWVIFLILPLPFQAQSDSLQAVEIGKQAFYKYKAERFMDRLVSEKHYQKEFNSLSRELDNTVIRTDFIDSDNNLWIYIERKVDTTILSSNYTDKVLFAQLKHWTYTSVKKITDEDFEAEMLDKSDFKGVIVNFTIIDKFYDKRLYQAQFFVDQFVILEKPFFESEFVNILSVFKE